MKAPRMNNLVPYVPGEQPSGHFVMKLNTNENPYPPSPKVIEAIRQYDCNSLRLYPDYKCKNLCRIIASREGVGADQVFAGNGSDEVLSFAWYAFFDGANGPLLFPEFSYSFYPVYCDFYSVPYKKIPLSGDWQIDISGYLTEKEYTGIAFPNPNAPTGNYLSPASIRQLADSMNSDRLLLVDEAYIEFGGKSSVSLISEFPNILVIRTTSKSQALAGMRVGYAIGSPETVAALFAVKDSFNSYPLDRIAQAAAEAAFLDNDYYAEVNAKIAATREWVSAEIRKRGWKCVPSLANFIFASPPDGDGERYFHALKQKGILVRYFDKPGLKGYLRISMGTDEQMHLFFAALEEM